MTSKRFNPEKDLAPARLVCRQLGIIDEVFESRRQRNPGSTPTEELFEVYGLIIETLKIQHY